MFDCESDPIVPSVVMLPLTVQPFWRPAKFVSEYVRPAEARFEAMAKKSNPARARNTPFLRRIVITL
jgi:hypothetical protein